MLHKSLLLALIIIAAASVTYAGLLLAEHQSSVTTRHLLDVSTTTVSQQSSALQEPAQANTSSSKSPFSPLDRWQPYHSNRLGISFKHPPEFFVYETPGTIHLSPGKEGLVAYEGQTQDLITIDVHPEVKFSSYLDLYGHDVGLVGLQLFTRDGTKGYKETWENPFEIRYVFDYHGEILSFRKASLVRILPQSEDRVYTLLDKMASTLRLSP